jgi:two-component system OmpR family sensor kinase
MTAQAAAWSEQDLERRFALGEPHDELTQLAATLDGLLDRLAASLRREHRFSAELSHELRTPLAKLSAEAELALRRPRTDDEYRAALQGILRGAAQLGRTLETLVLAARNETGGLRGTADAETSAREAAEGCSALAREGGIEIAVQPPPRPIRVGADADLVARVLQPLIENACRYGRSRVEITTERTGAGSIFRITDDGPGVAPADRERIFEPGVREPADGGGGAGLGLALARRLARSVGGDVEANANGAGGDFTVRLPAA